VRQEKIVKKDYVKNVYRHNLECMLLAEISWQIQLYLLILHGNLEAEI